MFRSFSLVLALSAFLAGIFAHQQSDFSDLYARYKAAGGKSSVTAAKATYDVSSPVSSDNAARDKSLFFPPVKGQNGRDYHPQLKSLAQNDTQIIYYSWHAHVYFFHEDANVTARTLALRDSFMKRFSLVNCDDNCFMGGPFDSCTQG
jgi:hypothetical protein